MTPATTGPQPTQRHAHVHDTKTQFKRVTAESRIGKAYYLCDNGARAGANLTGALYTYNHSSAYVAEVLNLAHRYTATTAGAAAASTNQPSVPGTSQTTQSSPTAPSAAAMRAIASARSQIGRPYLWGGTNPRTGFDCSGLTQAAYTAAGISLPRTADQQFHAGPRVAPNQPLQPGDLVFYGSPTVTHVAVYVGNNQVIQAPEPGATIGLAPLPRTGYVGATRPSSTRSRRSKASDSLHPPVLTAR